MVSRTTAIESRPAPVQSAPQQAQPSSPVMRAAGQALPEYVRPAGGNQWPKPAALGSAGSSVGSIGASNGPKLQADSVLTVFAAVLADLKSLLSAIGAAGMPLPAASSASGLIAGPDPASATGAMAAPAGLIDYQYGSLPAASAELVPNSEPLSYLTGYVPTPQRAGELSQYGLDHFAIPAWQNEIANAAERNGGLGTAQDGYLAWSKLGFVRLKNEHLTDKQNRGLAALSLQLGIEVERLPIEGADSMESAGNMSARIDGLLADFDSQLSEFLQNPEAGIHLKSGKRRFGLQMSDAGIPQAFYYKKKSGWHEFGSSVLKAAGSALQLISPTGPFVLAAEKLGLTSGSQLTQAILSQDVLAFAGQNAAMIADGELDFRGLLARYAQAAGVTGMVASAVLPGTQPLFALGAAALQQLAASESRQPAR